MKKLALTLASVLVTLGALGQGSVNFNNSPSATGSTASRIFGVDGITPLSGAQYQAILYAGPNAGSLAAVGASLPFRTGAGAGYVDTASGSSRSIASVVPGAPAVVEVRAWDTTTGATWDVAGIRGQSPDLNLATTGGAGAPPSLPVDLTGLQGFSLQAIPEPSTIALGVLGLGALLIRRRK